MMKFLAFISKTRILLLLLLLNIYLIFGFKLEVDKKRNESLQENELSYKEQRLCLLENESNALYLSVAENTPKESILAALPVIGIPSGHNANIKLTLLSGRQFVWLNTSNNQLHLKQSLDREEGLTNINVLIQCTPLLNEYFNIDVSSGVLFPLNISVFIFVTDVNDNAPKFTKNGKFAINLHEELPPGTPIRLDFHATDADQPGPNSHIRYRIEKNSSSYPSEVSEKDGINQLHFSHLLSIPDPFRAEIFVADRIDFERMPPYFSIQIEAEDQGNPRMRSLATLTVHIIDVDDQNPIFSSLVYMTGHSISNSLLTINPGQIRAWDGDSINETIVYMLDGENSYLSIEELNDTIYSLIDQLPLGSRLIIKAFQLDRPERSAIAFLLIDPYDKQDIVKKNSSSIICNCNQSLQSREIEQERSEYIHLSAVHILSAICFLLLLSNCATLSLWLGEKRTKLTSKLYDSHRYDSMENNNNKTYTNSFTTENSCKGLDWMLNRSLENDQGVQINKTNILPSLIGVDFSFYSKNNSNILKPINRMK